MLFPGKSLRRVPVLAVALVMLASLPAPLATSEPLPSWPGLEPRIAFWVDVYTRYTTRQAVLHDERHPEIVYAVVELGGKPDGGMATPPESDKEVMRLAQEWVSDVLRRLASSVDDPSRLSPREREILAAASRLPAGESLETASKRVRAQRGQSDRFRLGVIRSGRYLESFRQLAREAGVPEDLAYLPHVESAFDSRARSHVGATGLWQFMPGTARRFLTMDETRDERLDPWLSAAAAFRYLREAYDLVGTWPLAVTAYNHGPAGMARARDRMGDDLSLIVEQYESRSFGFASRNFYAEFLAARRVAQAPEAWFGPLAMDAPLRWETFPLPQFAAASMVEAEMGLESGLLQMLNPALPEPTWRGDTLLPAGYGLRVPAGVAPRLAASWDELPADARFERVSQETWHHVQRGESLGSIAGRYRTSVASLRQLNDLHGKRYIYPGQRLRVRDASRFVAVASATEQPGVHVVRRGDTLSSIGLRYGVALAELMRANELRDASRLLVGQVLVVPPAP